MNKDEYYRRLSRVEDREEKCVVNPQFSHFCQKHKQPTCARKNPPHCAWKGKLEVSRQSVEISDNLPPRKTYHLRHGNKYCEECIGQCEDALDAFAGMSMIATGPLHVYKLTPAEIQVLRERETSTQ